MDHVDVAPAPHEVDLVVVGQGYVGLPLALAAAEAGLRVVGVDVDAARVADLNAGRSHVRDVPDARLAGLLATGHYRASREFTPVATARTVVVCVPTPLRDDLPDLSAVEQATREVAAHLRPGTLAVLESTSYPGTTEEVFAPILLEVSGLGPDEVDIAFSPERIDPGNATYGMRNTPKVVGAQTPQALVRAVEFYGRFVDQVVPVSSTGTAEMAKLLENTFRHINIALANEMAMLCHGLGLDVWEVIDAAATKPFGFMPFRPGPGVGGHCIPVDPMYLSWKVSQQGATSRFISLARDVNAGMPAYVVARLQALLNDASRAVRGSEVLVVGVTYKPDVADLRESPALDVIDRLLELGARVCFTDPYVEQLSVPAVPAGELPVAAEQADCVLVLTAHGGVDHEALATRSRLLLDTRGVVRLRAPHVHRL